MKEAPIGAENRDMEESSGGVFVDDDNYPTEFCSGVTNEWEIIFLLNHSFLVMSSLKEYLKGTMMNRNKERGWHFREVLLEVLDRHNPNRLSSSNL